MISALCRQPCAVKQTKELEDNSQLKDDQKAPKLIAYLVKNGNWQSAPISKRLNSA